MNKIRRSSMMVRLVAVLAITMVFTMCFVGNTFAKYTSSATGTDTLTVAKWDIRVNNDNITTQDTFTFDLFAALKEANIADPETDVKSGKLLAPGTGGVFSIVIENKSEVTAKYAIDYTVTNTGNIPVEFSVDGVNWTSTLSDIPASLDTYLVAETGAKTVAVQWRWVFDGDDNVDTPLGIAASAQLVVTAEVTATQVD